MRDTSPAAEEETHLPAEHIVFRVGIQTLLSADHLCVIEDLVEEHLLDMQVVLLFKEVIDLASESLISFLLIENVLILVLNMVLDLLDVRVLVIHIGLEVGLVLCQISSLHC